MTEETSQKAVETNEAVAAGIASVVTAGFTSKFGVAGTLIGTALTAMFITIISTILKAQLMKASQTIAGLPAMMQESLPTQHISIPGNRGPEPEPEPAAQPKKATGGWLHSMCWRLRTITIFLKDLPSAQRRKVLLAGILAGLVATLIGLGTITGIEFAGGKTLSCIVWSCSVSAEESSASGQPLSILGGFAYTETSANPPFDEKQQGTSGGGQQAPEDQQPSEGSPAQKDDATPRQPSEVPGKEEPQPNAGDKANR